MLLRSAYDQLVLWLTFNPTTQGHEREKKQNTPSQEVCGKNNVFLRYLFLKQTIKLKKKKKNKITNPTNNPVHQFQDFTQNPNRCHTNKFSLFSLFSFLPPLLLLKTNKNKWHDKSGVESVPYNLNQYKNRQRCH